MYEVGKNVKHMGKYCKILEGWTSGQGFRYYVQHSKWLWSVGHKELVEVRKRK